MKRRKTAMTMKRKKIVALWCCSTFCLSGKGGENFGAVALPTNNQPERLLFILVSPFFC